MQGGGLRFPAERRGDQLSAKRSCTKLGLIFGVGFILQPSWKIALGLIIKVGVIFRETRYVKKYPPN